MTNTTTDGILMPMMANRFQLSLNQAGNCIFGKQVRLVEIDLLNKTMHMEVEQPVSDCGMFDEVIDVCSSSVPLIIQITNMAGNGKATCGFVFRHCKVTAHEYRLDYASNEIAAHTLTISFGLVQTIGYDQLSRQ